MHGRSGSGRGEDPLWRQHMWPVPYPATSSAPLLGPTRPVTPIFPSPSPASPPPPPQSSDSVAVEVDKDKNSVCFLKDGRKIRVGDCALFQAGNGPPFIGIIRWFTTDKEERLKLCVNWLYRPADLKLDKGILLEPAPNEVFYSFHKDVISAASLLHPCKVAFLRKGVELRSRISSFVCRLVYDIANKRLWWLTDQDYINEHQEEVDQLLDKTRVEMHAAVQSGGHSPKPLNAATSTQQIKSGADSVQNSGTSFPSQTKGKKRERGDQGTEPIKRERPTKVEDGDSANYKLDTMIKTEITKITEKGALINTEGVEKLVQLMQLGNERKIDLSGRGFLADVIAATDKLECLGRFVQLRGLPVLDDWLQEAHKGKTGDDSSPKESDKGTEELLLSLLRALDKLPVNLSALQNCNIGKSVNNLRSHKNLEIQKKARSLVDTWKKRVGAEMTKISDGKSVGSNQAVTWTAKPGFSETHAGSRRTGTEATSRSAISQPSACKTLGGKPGHTDAVVKLTVSPGSLSVSSSMPSAVSSKESPCRGAGSTGTSELPLAIVKEEKSSSSSQSQNNSQSSWKEDARSSTAGSISATKTSCGSSRHRRTTNGFLGISNSGVQKESNIGKSGSLNRSTLDKLSIQSGLSCQRAPDMPGSEHGNSHRLIVRLPNHGRSPARSASGGSLEDPSITGSRASSPGAIDKYDHVDRKTKGRVDASRTHISTDVNADSWQSNDVKVGLVGFGENDRSPTDNLDEECRCADEAGRTADVSRAACSSEANEKGVPSTEPNIRNSFSSINALVESCTNYSKASATLSAGDDIGMNLLASVAAGEMSKSGLVSPSGSPGSSPAKDEPCAGNSEAKLRFSHDDVVVQSCGQSDENAIFDLAKEGKVAVSVLASQEQQPMNVHFSGESKTVASLQEHKLTSEQVGQHTYPTVNLYKDADISMKTEVTCEEEISDKYVSTSSLADTREGLVSDVICQAAMDETMTIDSTHENIVVGIMKNSVLVCDSFSDGCVNSVGASRRKSEKLATEKSLACAPSDQVPRASTSIDKQLSAGDHVETVDRAGDGAVVSSTADKEPCPKIVDESRSKKCDELEVNHLDLSCSGRQEASSNVPSRTELAVSVVSVGNNNHIDAILERKEALEDHPVVGSAAHDEPPTLPAREVEISAKSAGSKLSGVDPDRREELATSAEAVSLIIPAQPDTGAKLDFDLNEGLPGDGVNQSEPITSTVPICSPAVRLPTLAPFVPGSLSTGQPSLITVAAAAKGAFVPPENLMRNKLEPGWKGSAATSAFHPAEPRKVLEMQPSTSDVQSSDAATWKHDRPRLDIDLNVTDERILEVMASQDSPQTTGSGSGVMGNRDAPTRSGGGLDLDLNRVDEGTENGQFLATTSSRLDAPVFTVRPFSGGFSNGEANMYRDFDLNNGPGMDEVGGEPAPRSQHTKSSNNVPSLAPMAGLRMGHADLGSVSSWFPPGNSYPAVAIPSFFPDRRDFPYPVVAAAGPQRILGSVTGGDVFRGPVLSSSSSHAMAFSPASSFPYAGFPFGASFPLASTSFSCGPTTYVDSSSGAGSCFPAFPSQLVGPGAGVSSHYPRPYAVSFPEGSTGAGPESNRRWARQGLDLNSGPGGADIEIKDDGVPSAARELPLSGSQAFVEEQGRMYQVPGGGVKRKEREGGSRDERFYKQPSWQ